MKANEFVKKYGWDEAKRVLVDCENQHRGLAVGGCIVNIASLKRLVESHELVEKLGGLVLAKLYVPDHYKSDRLKQALADVESCQ